MENEELNNEPQVDSSTQELQTSITELVEVIKQEQEAKAEEQVKQEEQNQLDQEELLLEEQAKEEELQLQEEEARAQQEADAEFKEQVIQLMSAEGPAQIDYTPYLTEISSQLSLLNEKNQEIIDQNEILITGSNTTLTHGIFYIPLAIIIFLLWRFFSTFLRSFR